MQEMRPVIFCTIPYDILDSVLPLLITGTFTDTIIRKAMNMHTRSWQE
jgi:hypothetical protein